MGAKVAKPPTLPPFTVEPDDNARAATGPRRITIIANPFGGGGSGATTAQRVAAALRERGENVTVLLTERAGHAMELAAEVDPGSCDIVVAVGGDGTVHEVVNGLAYGLIVRLGRDAAGGAPGLMPLSIVPCGSGNTVAFSLGITSVGDALAALSSGSAPRSMDLIELTHPDDGDAPRLPAGAPVPDAAAAEGVDVDVRTPRPAAPPSAALTLAGLRGRVQWSCNMVGWGLSSAVLEAASRMRWLGSAQYNCAAYSQVLANPAWVGRVEFVDPPGGEGVPATAQAVAEARAQAADARPWTAKGGQGLGAVEPAAAAAAVAPLLPVRPVPSEPAAFLMLQAQVTAYMGERMAFCPLARVDDGLMDLCAVLATSRAALLECMEAAKAEGAHVLGRGGRTGGALACVRYCQAREVVLRPLAGEELHAWLEGGAAGGGDDTAATARARRRLNIPRAPLVGAGSVNVDGELSGWSPVRMRVVPRALRVFVPPPPPRPARP